MTRLMNIDGRVHVDLSRLCPVAQRIAIRIVGRLELGAETFGPWKSPADKDMRREAMEEVIDAMIYAGRRLEEEHEKGEPQ